MPKPAKQKNKTYKGKKSEQKVWNKKPSLVWCDGDGDGVMQATPLKGGKKLHTCLLDTAPKSRVTESCKSGGTAPEMVPAVANTTADIRSVTINGVMGCATMAMESSRDAGSEVQFYNAPDV